MVTRQKFLGRTESRERERRTHMQAGPWNEGFRGKGATWKKKTQVGRDKVRSERVLASEENRNRGPEGCDKTGSNRCF